MNRYEQDILKHLVLMPYTNQRALSEQSGYSLGVVNKTIKSLQSQGYIDEKALVTDSGIKLMEGTRPKNAIILAAGVGMRMVPINTQTPKGLIEIKNEPLIERIISQLHEKGIEDINIVVGFMKEQYEYLIDKYNVTMTVNPEYSVKNNIHSLKLVADRLDNTYIIPCDIWCEKNPFSEYEPYSWYMVSNQEDRDSTVKVTRKLELAIVNDDEPGNTMIGISYLSGTEAKLVGDRLKTMCQNVRYEGSFWEETLCEGNKMLVQAKVVPASEAVEINTYEQLREFDKGSNHLKSDAIEIISKTLSVAEEDITDITMLKKGMTNRSFLFSAKGKRFIMRIPGEGTDKLINRREEAEVYNIVNKKNICDRIYYINPENGYKISEYIDGARVCDMYHNDDLKKCMKKLKEFHEERFQVSHEFDIFGKIQFYEELWEGKPSAYRDYLQTKENVFKLKEYIDSQKSTKCLTHIDAVPDNFLMVTDINKEEQVRLIDWEYAAMQDPHVDIAMFCIYAMYDREQVDNLIDIYFEGKCDRETRIKIYCYVAACGLLWSNWCEYKAMLGVEFGEYSLRQYRYGKDYYKIVQEELSKDGK